MTLDGKRFRQIDDARSLSVIALDYLIIVAVAVVAVHANHGAGTVIAIVIIAGRQVAFLNLMHAAAHYSLFSRKGWNDALGFLFAYPILDSVPRYRAPHLEHHRAFTLRVPHRLDYLYEWVPLLELNTWGRTWRVFLRPLLGYATYEFLLELWQTLRERRSQSWRIGAYWLLVLAMFYWLGALRQLLVFWLVPLFWLYPVLNLWAEISDHFGTRGDARNQRGFFYATLLKAHEAYHAVHHLYPYVPFYRLPALNEQLRAAGYDLEETSTTLDFLRIVYRGAAWRPTSDRGRRLSSIS